MITVKIVGKVGVALTLLVLGAGVFMNITIGIGPLLLLLAGLTCAFVSD